LRRALADRPEEPLHREGWVISWDTCVLVIHSSPPVRICTRHSTGKGACFVEQIAESGAFSGFLLFSAAAQQVDGPGTVALGELDGNYPVRCVFGAPHIHTVLYPGKWIRGHETTLWAWPEVPGQARRVRAPRCSGRGSEGPAGQSGSRYRYPERGRWSPSGRGRPGREGPDHSPAPRGHSRGSRQGPP